MKSYKPIQSIIVHKSDSDYFIESSEIAKIDGKYMTTGYKPLKVDTLKAIAFHFAAEKVNILQFDSFIPDNILYYNCTFNSNTVIWFSPKRKQHLFFKKGLTIPGGIAEVPNLIFKVNHNNLSVWAVLEKPTARTELYQAPFHNVNSSGQVCLGNVKIKERFSCIEELITQYETAFWKSEFSEVHGTPIKGNINLLWKDLIVNQKPFPEEVLIKTQLKAGDLTSQHKEDLL
jgi:PRTRC genetic system protein B